MEGLNSEPQGSSHFKGGGHKNASGGSSYSGLKSTVNKLKQILPEYKEQLTSWLPGFIKQ